MKAFQLSPQKLPGFYNVVACIHCHCAQACADQGQSPDLAFKFLSTRLVCVELSGKASIILTGYPFNK